MNAEEEGAIRLSIVGTEFLHVYFARSWTSCTKLKSEAWSQNSKKKHTLALRFVLYACNCHIHSHSRNQRWDLHLPSKFITTRRSVLHRGLALDFSGWTNHRVEYPCGRRQKTTNQVVSCQKSFDLEVGNWQKSESFESFAWNSNFTFTLACQSLKLIIFQLWKLNLFWPGLLGALYHNRQLTCCFCSCNLFLVFASIWHLGGEDRCCRSSTVAVSGFWKIL